MTKEGTAGMDWSGDAGAVLNCAVRYCLGRRTYMPALVMDFIEPLLPVLDSRTLWCFDQDICEADLLGRYGDPRIDEPKWRAFHKKVRAERKRRGEELYRSDRPLPPDPAAERMDPEGEDRMGAVRIRINTHGNPVPASVNGEWIDLATAEAVHLEPLEYRIINLGVSMELPEGYYAHIVPRSSTCQKYGVLQANSLGVIDRNYCGDNDVWGFPAVAIRATDIPKGVRICQFRLEKCPPPVEFEPVERLGNEDRGGFGSTGDMPKT